MRIAGKKACPFCKEIIPASALFCLHCGRDLHSMTVADSQAPGEEPYQVVPDGFHFGIAFEGEIRIHGLDLKKARDLAALLNSATAAPKAG